MGGPQKNAPEVRGPKTGSSRTISEMALDSHLNYMNHSPASEDQSQCDQSLFANVCLCEAIKKSEVSWLVFASKFAVANRYTHKIGDSSRIVEVPWQVF